MRRASFYDDSTVVQPIVIDNGSGFMKAGFAGSEIPSHIFPSFVGRVKHLKVMPSALEGDIFIGDKAEEHRGLLILNYPIDHGIVTDWSDMELVWNYVYSELQAIPEKHPVLLTEAPLNPNSNRQKTAELFFETFGCPSLFIAAQAVLALYATGRTSGVVIDIGDGVSHVVPVMEGFALTNAITRSDVAGRSITDFLSLLLRRAGYIFHTSAEMQVVRQVKESSCFVLFNPQLDSTLADRSRRHLSGVSALPEQAESTPEILYNLPDGTPITLNQERYMAPEILFNPMIIGSEYMGVHQLLMNAINKADMDLRKTLYTQIVLSGGSTFFVGFGERLLNELRKAAPKDNTIRVSAPADRKTMTWAGGSILASLSAFKKMWITRQDYEELGSKIIGAKTF